MSTLLEQASLVMIPSGYKEDIVYSQIPTNGNGDLSFTRASNGTRVNSAGLVEVCPWNLMSYSEQFDNAFWIKAVSGSATFTVTANQTTAPNGTNTADLVSITRSATSELSAIYTTVGQGIGTFKNTIWLKAKDSSNVGKTIDLWSWEGATRGYTKITLTADWVRYEQNTTVFTGSASELLDFGLLPIAYSTSTTLAVEFYAWGGQSNIGSTAKPYFPTTDRLNVPRLTYQNGGGGCPSLLLEPQRTNLCTYSQDFSNADWNTSLDAGCSITITPNYTTASNGLPAARLVASRTNTSTLAVIVNYKPNTSTSATKSIWMKNNNSGNVTIMFGDEVVTITDTWERYSVTNTYLYAIVGLRYSGVALSCDISITGSQFEVGSYPTSYIPTTSASATRVADSFSRNNIYTNGLITSSGGTWFVSLLNNVAYTRDAGGFFGLLTSSTLSTNGFVIKTASGTLQRLFIGKRVADVESLLYTTITDTIKLAIKWNGTSADVFVNGTKQVNATSFTATVMEFLTGNAVDVPKFFSQMALFPTPLTDAECQALTTL